MKEFLIAEAILVGILVGSIVFMVMAYEIPTSNTERLPKVPDSETTCGEGTIEIDGICYGYIEIDYNYSFSSKTQELVLES